METAAGLGSLIGGVLASRMHPRHPLLIGGLAVALTPLGLVPLIRPLPLAITATTYGMGFAALMVFGILWETALQDHVPHEVYARVVSWDLLVSWSILPIGTALAGYLRARYGTATTVGVAIAVMLVGALGPLTVKETRTLTNEHSEVHS